MRRTRIYLAGSTSSTGWLGRILQATVLFAVLVLSLMFSVIIIPTVILLGLMMWGYVWWKTRALREQLKAAADAVNASTAESFSRTEANSAEIHQNQGTIIDGEAIRVDSGNPSHIAANEAPKHSP